MPHENRAPKTFCVYVVLSLFLLFSTCSLQADALDNWTSNSISFGSFSPYGMVYGNGLYIAVGGDGYGSDFGLIFSSPDGTNWTLRSTTSETNFTSELYGVACGQGTFVAVGYMGYLYTSTNGLNWTSQQLPADNLNAVTWGNGVFIAAGNNAVHLNGDDSTKTFFISTNGLNWGPAVLNYSTANPDIAAVAGGNGFFLGAGRTGILYYSDTGTNWFENTSTFGINSFSSLIYGGNLFVASYGSSTNLIVSATGFPVAFPHPSLQSTQTKISFGALSHDDNIFLGSGYSSTLSHNVFLSSTDGISWTPHTFQFSSIVKAFASDGHRIVAVGQNFNTGLEGSTTGTAFVSDPVVSLSLQFHSAPEPILSGVVGFPYRIDYLYAFAASGSNNWQTFTNITLSASPYSLPDKQFGNAPSRFYRAVLLSP